MKLKIIGKSKEPKDNKVFLDGKDISKNVARLKLELNGEKLNRASITFIPDDIELDSQFEITHNYSITKNSISPKLLNFIHISMLKGIMITPSLILDNFKYEDIPKIRVNLNYLKDSGMIDFVWTLGNDKLNFIFKCITPAGIKYIEGDKK